MIRFERVTVTYDGAPGPVLREVTLRVPEGELCLVIGRTGAGKSTLLGAINGLVPHFTGGTLAGRVTVAGRDTAQHPPRELADIVGVVGQDPLAGFVTDTVEEELAYGMEQLAVAPQVMRKRVEETLDLLGLAPLRDRPLRALSGGQQQRVAIGAVLTAHPQVLVLDEPTSALDPVAAEEVLAAVTRLVHDLGMTVVLAEHRLERVVQYADSVIYLPGDGTAALGTPSEIFTTAGVAPPVVQLGRLAGWQPLPLSVRGARRQAVSLRERLAQGVPHGAPSGAPATATAEAVAPGTAPAAASPTTAIPAAATPLLNARGVVVRYGEVVAVRGVDLALRAGEITALMGRNGSGKSSLLWALQGSGRRQGGTVEVDGRDPRAALGRGSAGAGRAGAADAGRPPVPEHRRCRTRPGRPRGGAGRVALGARRIVFGTRAARSHRFRDRRRCAPARSLRGATPQPRARDPAMRGATRNPAGRADPRARLTAPSRGSVRSCAGSRALGGRS